MRPCFTQFRFCAMTPQNSNGREPVRVRRLDIYRSITDHRGCTVNYMLRQQALQLLPLLNPDVSTVHKIEVITDLEVFQYPFREINSLRGANPKPDTPSDQVQQTLRHTGV